MSPPTPTKALAEPAASIVSAVTRCDSAEVRLEYSPVFPQATTRLMPEPTIRATTA